MSAPLSIICERSGEARATFCDDEAGYGTKAKACACPVMSSAAHERDALRAELDAVLADWNALVAAVGSPTNGGAVGRAAALRAEVERLREALRRLISAADAVGVEHFDTDSWSDEVTEMNAATRAAEAALSPATPNPEETKS